MTKKAGVLAVVATFACCGTASAAVLPLKTAKQVAKRLAAKQVATRQIVSVHIGTGHRVNAAEIKFAYGDRSVQNIFCTSLIVVKLRSNGVVKGAFDTRANVCRGITSDALAYEAATRSAVLSVGSQAPAVLKSVKSLKLSSLPCRHLHVPANRRAQVALFRASATSTAVYGPIDSQLQQFVNSLGVVRTSDGVLVAGAAAWGDLLEVYRALPAFPPSLCGAILRWQAAHWAAAAAPANYSVLKALDARARRDMKAIARAGAHLANLGVFPRTAVAFTPSGLVALAVGTKTG
jgi:hypothetical protein